MPKLKLLILDAGVVIYLHELGLWSKIVASCDLYLSRIVAEKEVLFQKSEQDEYGYDIDLSAMITTGAITVFDVSVSDLKTFRDQFDLLYLGDLDDGEAESLAYLVRQSPEFLISSGDAIVYRVLGNLNRGEQGNSLEEILQKLGLGRSVQNQYTKRFREQYTRQGQQDMVRGRGKKQ
ncbi:MAG: hypothetical protein JNL58_28185 [Planctomyces sp.]|nr:hypothetical protein [Planctomyces sp.]